MASFTIKKLTPVFLVGEVLKNERARRRLTIEEAAQTLGLSAKYIQILETNAWAKLPGEVYAKSFIKKYARFLELDPEAILNQYLEDSQRDWLAAAPAPKHPRPNLGLKQLSSVPAVFRHVALSGLLLILTLYLSYEVAGVFSPPYLAIESPDEGAVNTGEVAVVKGRTEPEARVQINGKEVVSDGRGAFSASVGLQGGLNIIKVSATKRHGGTSTISRNIVIP